ncbi:alpha-ketoglutarate-dependent dioxygenase alkB homolog 6 [Condylostylus longicornis]|uniref:alpha-ketoglutarate-dependent dioxygenase alkB homolog 6 n=1 Tax=Condylostylus longicornis TaxID=2530218 RepID=UPI00244E4099|nr:alpha-ketoglutarate-dependent dioxygenase alkB homolog 6 [Condylostylus longicornis]
MDLSNFLVRNCPKTAMYIPNFITLDEEQNIIANIEKTPKPKWTQLSHRRLINYGGVPHANGMIAEEIPKWLNNFVEKVNNLNIFETKKANHVLINEYNPGEGIMPHTDGPLFYPIISTISCGSYTILEFVRQNIKNHSQKPNCNLDEQEVEPENKSFKLLIEPRSLLILKDNLYTDYMHSIDEVSDDFINESIVNLENCELSYKYGDRLCRKKRLSLTIRHVPKTSKLKLNFSK